MMWSLIRKSIREKRISLIIYCLAGAASVWLYVSIFPSLQSQAAQVSKLMESFPKDVLRAFGAEGTGLENVESLLATKQFGLIWPILVIILMLSRAAAGIAGEIEAGTIGTLLSQPLSRTRIYFSRYISAVLTLLIFVASTVLISIPLIAAYKLEFSVRYELIFAGFCTLLGLAILGVGMFVSAISNERSRVYSYVGGAVVLMFILNIVSGLQPSLEKLKYLSVFYYYNASQVIVHHHVNTVSVLLFAFTAVLGLLAGLIVFNKRDISI